MRIAVVSDDKEKLLDSDFINSLKEWHEVRFVPPLIRKEYGVSVEELLEKEKETVPFYRCDLVLYRAFSRWESLIYTMQKVLGFAVVNGEDDGHIEDIQKYTAALIHEDNVNVNELPKYLHWYNRSINEITQRYEKFSFHMDNLEPYYEAFLGVPMSIDKIIDLKGGGQCR